MTAGRSVVLSLTPGGGTVDFFDSYGRLICSAVVDPNVFMTVPSCEGVDLPYAPLGPITVIYSGTQFGSNDGHGTSYAGSSAQGTPD